jgi:hypothetical protein
MTFQSFNDTTTIEEESQYIFGSIFVISAFQDTGNARQMPKSALVSSDYDISFFSVIILN